MRFLKTAVKYFCLHLHAKKCLNCDLESTNRFQIRYNFCKLEFNLKAFRFLKVIMILNKNKIKIKIGKSRSYFSIENSINNNSVKHSDEINKKINVKMLLSLIFMFYLKMIKMSRKITRFSSV